MWKTIVLCFLVFGTSLAEEEQVWDYFYFSQIWQPGYCEALRLENSSNSCYFISYNDWTVQGLWPTSQIGSDPEYCADDAFNVKNNDILVKLFNDWPNVWVRTGDFYNDSFNLWENEWNKHGSCADTLDFMDSQEKYFNVTMNLNRNYIIYNILYKDSIVACNSCSYDFEQINSTLTKSLGKKTSIQCTKNNNLQEIGICFDKELNAIDCTKYPTSCNVTELIHYPIVIPQKNNSIY